MTGNSPDHRRSFIAAELASSAETKQRIAALCADDIVRAVEAVVRALRAGNKILLCGNGGSAADSQHGKDGGITRGLVDIAVVVPSGDTQRIQEGHITIGHIICSLAERELYA
jgi:D-sedoheptulose 7-phosphate isomerase